MCSSRMSLLCMLCAAMDGAFVLENPGSSLIFCWHLFLQAVRLLRSVGLKAGPHFHPQQYECFSWAPLLSGVWQVYRIGIWMQDFKHPTPKPTILVGNTDQLSRLLHEGAQKKQTKRRAEFETAVKYTNSRGEECWKGSPNLKSTQFLGENSVANMEGLTQCNGKVTIK